MMVGGILGFASRTGAYELLEYWRAGVSVIHTHFTII